MKHSPFMNSQWVQKLSLADKTQTNTLIVSSCSSRNKNKNGKNISVNIKKKINNRYIIDT